MHYAINNPTRLLGLILDGFLAKQMKQIFQIHQKDFCSGIKEVLRSTRGDVIRICVLDMVVLKYGYTTI
jgi:hypothetical protein